MAKQRTYRVTFHPATATYTDDGRLLGWEVTYGLAQNHPPVVGTLELAADNLAAIEARIRAHVGDRCQATTIRLTDGGRKPNGFDAWAKRLYIIDGRPAREHVGESRHEALAEARAEARAEAWYEAAAD